MTATGGSTILCIVPSPKPPPSRPRSQPATRTLKLDDSLQIANQVQRAVRDQYRPALIVLTGDSVGERISLHGNALVGRDPDAEIVLTDQGVSWQHAFIEDRGGRYVVVDLQSTNGTFVNGERATEIQLSSGDKIRFGKMTVRFEVQDATDEQYNQLVSNLIHIDDLTGLYLRRRFDAELAGLVETARTQGTAVGLLAMDLDGIKAINDTHGHLFGAYTIAQSGKLIGEAIAGVGIACRFGGDEFVAAFPEVDLEQARETAERILTRINEYPYEYEGIRLHPGISIGVATFPADAQTAVELFKAADAALYVAKRAGKNCVRIHGAD